MHRYLYSARLSKSCVGLLSEIQALVDQLQYRDKFFWRQSATCLYLMKVASRVARWKKNLVTANTVN